MALRADEDGGYATVVAAVICLGVALMVTALMGTALAELRQARADLSYTQRQLRLDQAQSTALLAVATSSRQPPYRWRLASGGEAVTVLAEPEVLKASPAVLAALSDAALKAFGVADVEALRANLETLKARQDVWLADQSRANLWQACAPSLASYYGEAEALTVPTYETPDQGTTPGFWRAGEVWRLRVATDDGWQDERIVRFTGDGADPARVIAHRLIHHLEGNKPCDIVLTPPSES